MNRLRAYAAFIPEIVASTRGRRMTALFAALA